MSTLLYCHFRIQIITDHFMLSKVSHPIHTIPGINAHLLYPMLFPLEVFYQTQIIILPCMYFWLFPWQPTFWLFPWQSTIPIVYHFHYLSFHCMSFINVYHLHYLSFPFSIISIVCLILHCLPSHFFVISIVYYTQYLSSPLHVISIACYFHCLSS